MQDTEAGAVDEDWEVLLSFLPQDWRELAQDTGALKGLRKDKAVDNLLRTLLLHLGCGHSLRETVVRARQAHLADLSDVALLKRLKKSKGWLHALCVRLFEEQGLAVVPGAAFQVRAVDATTVKEPGPSGSLWRLHYSVGLPSLTCDFFKLTGTEGPGTGESLAQFPIRAGDHVLADRGYSTARGIRHVADAGGRLIVRVNTGSLPLCTAGGRPFDLLAAVSSVTRPGAVSSWATMVAAPGDDRGPACDVAGRVCVLRKSAEAIRLAHQKIRRDAARKGNQVQPATLRFAEYVIVFTTFPEPPFSAADVKADEPPMRIRRSESSASRRACRNDSGGGNNRCTSRHSSALASRRDAQYFRIRSATAWRCSSVIVRFRLATTLSAFFLPRPAGAGASAPSIASIARCIATS